ncbi:hypothetical protein LAN32_23050, partial [Mycobacterium tuberculosis]|nr:hypothetical protein [Mycobacterium tuberculosis]
MATAYRSFGHSYAEAGALAPVLLCVLRFGQGIGLGGEWGGAPLPAGAHAPRANRTVYGRGERVGCGAG